MSDLSTRQERFCQEYASGASGAEAARRAGYSPRGADVQACRLLAKANVKARVAELQAETAKEIQWTREDHLRRLHEIGEAAERAKHYGVAARCEELRGKVLGFYAEPAETPEERPSPRDLAPTGDALLRLPGDRAGGQGPPCDHAGETTH